MFKLHDLWRMRYTNTARSFVIVLVVAAFMAMPLSRHSVEAQSCSSCSPVSCRPASTSALTPDIVTAATATVTSSTTVDFAITLNSLHIMTINQSCSDPDGLQINGGTGVCGPSACTQILQGYNTVTMSVTYCGSGSLGPCFTIKFQSGGALGIIRPKRKSFHVTGYTPGSVNSQTDLIANNNLVAD